MPIVLDAQQWNLLDPSPAPEQIQTLLDELLLCLNIKDSYTCTVRVVDEADSADLNSTYRHKTGPTNVLSFPYESIAGIESELLGDLIICAPLVEREAEEQNKTSVQHFSHLIVHGVLHLLGYDHQTSDEADEMEKIEIQVLEKHGFPNPYEAIDQT